MHPPSAHLLALLLTTAARVAQVLYYRRIHDELVLGSGLLLLTAARSVGGFGDERFQDVVDDGVVPGLRLAVLVDGGGGDGGVAGVVADLAEAGGWDGLLGWVLVGRRIGRRHEARLTELEAIAIVRSSVRWEGVSSRSQETCVCGRSRGKTVVFVAIGSRIQVCQKRDRSKCLAESRGRREGFQDCFEIGGAARGGVWCG